VRDFSLRDVANRVGAQEIPSASGGVEGAAEVATKMVERLGREIAALLVEEVLDEPRREINQSTLAERRSEDVLADGAYALVVRRLPGEVLGDPPGHQIIDGAAAVLRRLLVEAVPDPVFLDLNLARQLDRLGLGPGVRHSVAPAA
jgi:hypothetical protein